MAEMFFKHNLSDVQSDKIGKGSKIWQFTSILPMARIGDDVNICANCFIENDVIIGNRVTIKSGVQLWDGTVIEDDVFIGPNTSFCNDIFPRSKKYNKNVMKTIIHQGASVGAGATLLPGISVGRFAMVGAGAVVTKSVPPYAIVVGNPAKIIGYDNLYKLEHSEISDSVAKELTLSNKPKLINLQKYADIRGSLSVGEFKKDIPFDVKRYFIVYDVPSIETRGEHAHKECHQFLICLNGSLNVVVDDGQDQKEFILNNPNSGLDVPAMLWAAQYNFSSDAVLLVFASEFYDDQDYIRDYDSFINLVRQK
jgi:UDP-2-acetamido-3-amino-2,3-dideoxy-glucuronate N-acetyltransferase